MDAPEPLDWVVSSHKLKEVYAFFGVASYSCTLYLATAFFCLNEIVLY